MDKDTTAPRPTNFIRNIIDEDLASGKNGTRVATRFPPEPNGYLHVGHAKSICLNFGIARDYGGTCNLRMDDTNPEKESEEYMQSIEEDVRWLGFSWDDRYYHASDYFDALHGYAVDLIKQGKAYVDGLSPEEIRAHRGTLTEPGRDSPYRDRSIEENLAMFERMRAGEFADGEYVLRAKIDMSSPNINLRDPTIYRIRKTAHHRTGAKWNIYPMYDYTHCISDALEGITHSICTLEFEDHRPLYDWVLDQLDVPCHPQQIEFARLELNYTITSKRKLHALVHEGLVAGWDDPRLPTLKGMRRRGYPPAALRDFADRVGVTKKQTVIDMGVLENCVREELDRSAPRAMAVLDPVKLVIENYPAGQREDLAAANHPKDESMGTRAVPFGREIWIEREDFMEDPPKKFFRLAPGREVRLRYAYFVTCTSVVKDADGNVTEIRCTYDPATRGGNAPDGRPVKGTIHWVSIADGVDAEVRLYDRLFNVPDPGAREDFRELLNPDSKRVIPNAKLEPALGRAAPGQVFQFERTGYFCADSVETKPGTPVFNRTATLRDTWSKVAQGD
ncbi:MAG: glutamine--tRNA ligase/YqeY domain fusion protein [Gammaproteobacteria bacterium]|nr:glutamine--tRNA ligase/YqeY domain fusion protein [Gammaproteobacteria bacterium]MBI5615574.1 glutamine--tRNA ligase/YqeY domain fusion protein [Gammaproteobacteria bacterium]